MGGCCIPQSWKIYYKDKNEEWVPVENINQYGVEKGFENEAGFKAVTTKALKIEVKLPEKNTSGIFEWEVE